MNTPKKDSGNAVVIVLVALVVIAVGALAYLSGQMAGENGTQASEAQVASAENEIPANTETTQAQAENADEVADGQDSAIAEATPEPTVIAEGNPVVAKMDGREIKRQEVFEFIQSLPAQTRQIPIDQLYPLALEQVINAALVENKTQGVNLDSDPEVQKQLAEAKEQIVRSVFIQNAVEEKITEDRLQAAYEEYKKNFPEAEEVKAAHILVEDEAKAKALIARLEQGEDFAKLASENSTDTTAENGGELGYFLKQDVVAPFGEAAFSTAVGSYTKEPVKSEFGYHIIKIEDKRMRKPAEYAEAKPFLEAQLRRTVLDEIVQGWRSEANIERFDINGKPIEPAAGEESPAADASAAQTQVAE